MHKFQQFNSKIYTKGRAIAADARDGFFSKSVSNHHAHALQSQQQTTHQELLNFGTLLNAEKAARAELDILLFEVDMKIQQAQLAVNFGIKLLEFMQLSW